MTEGKQRHWCLTAFLWVGLFLNLALVALILLLIPIMIITRTFHWEMLMFARHRRLQQRRPWPSTMRPSAATAG